MGIRRITESQTRLVAPKKPWTSSAFPRETPHRRQAINRTLPGRPPEAQGESLSHVTWMLYPSQAASTDCHQTQDTLDLHRVPVTRSAEVCPDPVDNTRKKESSEQTRWNVELHSETLARWWPCSGSKLWTRKSAYSLTSYAQFPAIFLGEIWLLKNNSTANMALNRIFLFYTWSVCTY